MSTREAACHCGQLRLEVDGRSVRRLDLPLPRMPAAHRKRVRHAGRLQARSGQHRGPLQRLLAHLRRGRRQGARPPLLPRVRLAGLLHGADGAGPDRRLGRLVRRPVVPAADRVGVRLAAAPWVVLPDTIMRGPAPELWDPIRPLYEAGEYAEAADRGLEVMEAHPGNPRPLLQRRVLREPRRADGGRARAPRARDRDVRTDAGRWRRATRTSTRFATSRRSSSSSAASRAPSRPGRPSRPPSGSCRARPSAPRDRLDPPAAEARRRGYAAVEMTTPRRRAAARTARSRARRDEASAAAAVAAAPARRLVPGVGEVARDEDELGSEPDAFGRDAVVAAVRHHAVHRRSAPCA